MTRSRRFNCTTASGLPALYALGGGSDKVAQVYRSFFRLFSLILAAHHNIHTSLTMDPSTITSQKTTVCRWLPEDPSIVAEFVSDLVQVSRVLHGLHPVTREPFARPGDKLDEEVLRRAQIDFDIKRLDMYRKK